MSIVYATTTTWISESLLITEGEPWESDDPVVRSHPALFVERPGTVRRSVEQATAAPGEQRQVTKVDAAADEAAELRAELTAAGVKVDNRWSLDTLRQKKAELDK